MSQENLVPREPETMEDTGLPSSTVEHLIFKILYFRGDLYGQELSIAIGLKFSVIEDIVETFKLRNHIQVKRSLGMGTVGSVLSLTEAGRARARELLEKNQYQGAAPVPLSQYVEMVRQQRPREGWLTKDLLARAFRGLVVSEQLLSQIGPAVSSANSLLLYGKPGNGKTALIESLGQIEQVPIFVPYAIECQGNIIQVYDPIYHQRVEEDAPSVLAVSAERSHDQRWVKCRRPFIVSGGELTADMLDLRFNSTSRIYEAPFQLKANNGIYLIDDFGRQRATPAEVLNRWIVPMERRVDYLSFMTGGKMTAPFEAFLVFSTNLNPADLGDEAFLRRIQYKMLLRGPTEAEFVRIFESYCVSRQLACPPEVLQRFLERRYRAAGKVMRRCHPRDVLTHASDFIAFEKLPLELTDDVLDRAFESCFLEDQGEDGTEAKPAETPLPQPIAPNCADYWGEELARINTAFGALAFVAALRNRTTGRYHDRESERQFGEAETTRVLEQCHVRAFRYWLSLERDQRLRGMSNFLAAADRGAATLASEPGEWVSRVIPADAKIEESCLFTHDLGAVLGALSPAPASGQERKGAESVEPVLERSA